MDSLDKSEEYYHILLIINHDLTQMSDFGMKKIPKNEETKIKQTNNNNDDDDDDDDDKNKINKTKNHVSEKRAIIIQHRV